MPLGWVNEDDEESDAAFASWKSVDGKEWSIIFQLQEIAGRMECTGVLITSEPEDRTAEPAPLFAGTLRELPFGSLLTRARRERVEDLRRKAKFFEGPRQPGQKMVTGTPAARVYALMTRHRAKLIDSPQPKAGRHAKYTRADLERVARVYAEAYAGGSRSPTKDVAECLNLSHSEAAKLVMRCRDSKVALLAPTQKRTAGGILPPSAS
jgi:hypothetical protein